MSSLDEIRNERIKKLNILKEQGINPYPIKTKKSISVEKALKDFSRLSEETKEVSLAGRVTALRGQGSLVFFNFDDGTGKLQGMLKKEDTPDKYLELFSDTVDVGDFVSMKGNLFLSKRGEKSILVKEWAMLSKSLRSLPDKWHGLSDVEERFRKRYLDTLMSEEVKERFLKRSKVISSVREFLNKSGYVEVETPILQHLAGGATAEPFKTHHNSLDIDLYLRIAPELYLKKLLVGGFPKVYEIGRNFRNEGIDVTHNPEFTMLEFYEAYSDAKSQMSFVEKMIKTLVKKISGANKIHFEDKEINFSGKFEKVSYLDLLKKYALLDKPLKMNQNELIAKAEELGVEVKITDAPDKILDNIYKKMCRPNLIQPTFIIDYPLAFSPFAKRQEKKNELIDRFQLVLGGLEVVNAFSELNDPLEQRDRYLEQDKKRRGGEAEVSPKDEEYLEAMEYGMPPAGGVGIGIDRIVMILTGVKNIKEVILFPTMKPRE